MEYGKEQITLWVQRDLGVIMNTLMLLPGGGGTPSLQFVQAVVLICGTSWRPPPTQEFYLSGFTVGGCRYVPVITNDSFSIRDDKPASTDIYILQQKEKEVLYSTSVIQNLQFDF